MVGQLAHTSRAAQRRFWKRYGIGYLFISPALVLFALFVVYPFVQSMYLSLTEWNGADPQKTFVGLRNYWELAQDELLWLSLSHNLVWMVLGPVGAVGGGMALALLLWSRPRGFWFFRTVFFVPQVLGPAVIGIIWLLIYQAPRGGLYLLGRALGIDFLRRSLLGNLETALFAVLIASIWGAVGYFFVILLAGLQNVDPDLIDAATVDGANGPQRFRHVIVPQLSNVLTMVLVLALIGALNVFDIIWAMTQGGPANSTEVISTYTYTEAFLENNIGYASALTMVMTAIALLTSWIFIRVREGRDA